jgi:hypothetical protein
MPRSSSSKNSQSAPAAAGAGSPPSSPSRKVLEEKYKSNLAAARDRRSRLQHIRKVSHPICAGTLNTWVKDGLVIVADWNRDEVIKREGTPDEWMESLATKISPGHFIAYWEGTADAKGKIHPTRENPLVIYEGGHRTRWTTKVFNNEATYCDMPYRVLQAIAPDIADEIRDRVIEMTVNISVNREELHKFAKRDYDRVNSLICALNPGERIRTRADETRAGLEDAFRGAFKRKLPPKARDGDKEDIRALVHGAAGLTAQMNKKAGALTPSTELTQEQVERATEVINCVRSAEQQISELFTDKAVQKRVLARNLDLAMDGVFVWALNDAKSPAGRDAVVADWVQLHRKFFESKDEWTTLIKDLRKSTVERSRYGPEGAWPGRWVRVLNAVYPPPSDTSGVEVDVVVPV